MNATPISIIIPVYRSAETLPGLVSRIRTVAETHGFPLEVILVEDGSPDDSAAVCRTLAREHPDVRFIGLTRNFGQHNATLCGIRHAVHPILVTMDDDGQHPPESLPQLLEALDASKDVVYGVPEALTHAAWRNQTSFLAKWALSVVFGAEIAPIVNSFRVFRQEIGQALDGYDGPYVNVDVLLSWGTDRFGSCQIPHLPRQRGTSNYTLTLLFRHLVNMLTGFSTLPLHAASLLGLVLTLFGAALFVFCVGRWAVEGTIAPGFPFLACMISIFSGAQLFTVGVLGAYVARIHLRLMQKPTYLIREDVSRAPSVPTPS